MTMTRAALACATVMIALAAASCGTQSSRGAWCSDPGEGGVVDCGYFTLRQCKATASGVGGVCVRNAYGPQFERRWPKRARSQPVRQ